MLNCLQKPYINFLHIACQNKLCELKLITNYSLLHVGNIVALKSLYNKRYFFCKVTKIKHVSLTAGSCAHTTIEFQDLEEEDGKILKSTDLPDFWKPHLVEWHPYLKIK